MGPRIPTPIPQIPVRDLEQAISFYQSRLGFELNWKHEDCIAGLSRDDARVVIERVVEGRFHPVRIWLNLDSVADVDALHGVWKAAGVTITSAPEQKPWELYEFIAQDCEGNSYRVFHDTGTPHRERG